MDTCGFCRRIYAHLLSRQHSLVATRPETLGGTTIPVADKLYDEHLEQIQKEGLIDGK